MVSRSALRRWWFVALPVVVVAWIAFARGAAAQGCTVCSTNERPRVVISPESNPENAASIVVTITVTDDRALSATPIASQTLTGFTGTWASNNSSGIFTGTLSLSSGANTLIVSIVDADSDTGADTVTYYYNPASSPQAEAAATLSEFPHSSTVRSVACGGCLYGSVSHTTPAYVSRDVSRAVTLFYSSAQAVPRGFVQLNATVNTTTTPSSLAMRLVQGGSSISLTNGGSASWYSGATGLLRVAAQFDASGLSSGVYRYTAGVTTHWGGNSYDATVPVRVLIINEAGSRVGAGWSIAGHSRIVTTGDSVAILDGLGGMTSTGVPAPRRLRQIQGRLTR